MKASAACILKRCRSLRNLAAKSMCMMNTKHVANLVDRRTEAKDRHGSTFMGTVPVPF